MIKVHSGEEILPKASTHSVGCMNVRRCVWACPSFLCSTASRLRFQPNSYMVPCTCFRYDDVIARRADVTVANGNDDGVVT